MSAPTTNLRAEVTTLVGRAEALRTLGDSADRSLDIWMPQLTHAITFVQEELIPHLDAADQALYGALGGVDRRTPVAQCASCDRSAISDLGMQLAFFRSAAKAEMPANLRELRRIAYGLYALVHTQLDREERLLRVLECGSTRSCVEAHASPERTTDDHH